MNDFRLEGIVEAVEVCQSGKGRTYYRFTIRADGEAVPLMGFKPVREGDAIQVEGRITTWKGFPQLKVERIAEIEEADPIAAARNVERETLCTVGADGELPF